jgi:gamma-glutamyl-gamma-aminobutyrate hydrolase PuuD
MTANVSPEVLAASPPPLIAVATFRLTECELLAQDYVTSLSAAGGIPFIIPPTANSSLLDIILSRMDGALLPGGPDVNPLLYGEDPLPQLTEVQSFLDDFQRKFIESAAKFSLPLFGICRGQQLLNVHFGGTLYQDIQAQIPGSIKHTQLPTRKHNKTHRVEILEGTNLREILGGRSEVITNSAHHQAVKDVAPGFRVTAVARDGVIEGIERIEGVRIWGVQWHPEGHIGAGDNEFLPLFRELVDQAKLGRLRKGMTE